MKLKLAGRRWVLDRITFQCSLRCRRAVAANAHAHASGGCHAGAHVHHTPHQTHVRLACPPPCPQVNQFVKLTGWTDSCPEPGNQESCRVYIAEGGDSLSTIAMAFSVDLSAVRFM